MVIGVLGGGQLARMLALDGYPLGLQFVVLDPAADICSASVAQQLQGNYDDEALLSQLASMVDVVTYEFENVPSRAVEYLNGKVPVFPPPQALAIAQDRLNEKTMFRELAIATPAFAAVNSLAELQQAMEQIGWPAVLKTRSQGYDGKGQAVLRQADDLVAAWQSIGGAPSIVEAFVAFEREVSIIAARSCNGEIVCYPLTENIHQDGILQYSIVCSDDSLQSLAEEYAQRLLTKLDYVGVLALELFQSGGQLLANEYAPRVHNSGHWTQDGAETSQFENHLRAGLDLPLGATDAIGYAAMVNLIGDIPTIDDVLVNVHSHLHLYDKQARSGRKVGHINLRAQNKDVLEAELKLILKLVSE